MGTEDALGVALTVVGPAEDGGEGEEDDGDGHDVATPVAGEALLEGVGGHQAGTVLALVPDAGADDDQTGEGDDDDGVDEGLGHGDQALADRVGGLRGRGGDSGGTHAGLVGEDTAGDTHLEGQQDSGADETTCGGGTGEGVGEDQAEGVGELTGVDAQHHDASDDVDDDHQRDEGGGDLADGLDAAEKDGADEDEHDDTGDHGVDPEGFLQVRGDRVGLGHVADTEGRDDGGEGEEPGEELTEGALDAPLEVALRSTGHVALGVRDAVPHTEERLGVLGRHAEQAGDPHPEQGAGATDGDGGGDTDDIADADGGGQGGGQCLVLGDVTFAGVVVAVEEAESQGGEELAELHAPEPDGEDEAGSEQ